MLIEFTMIIALKNVLSKNTVGAVQEALTTANWQDGGQSAGHLAKDVKDNLQLAQNDPLAIELGKIMVSALAQHPEFQGAAVPRQVFPPMFNCYQNGGHFGKHVDNSIRFCPQTGNAIRTDLSVTIFLNDAEDYQGGELIVHDLYGEHSVKLNAGDAVLYPSGSLHQVLPVTKGKRLASFFWLQSFVGDHEKRALLYQLDQSIQSLTQQQIAKDEVTRLTHVYHNLLRSYSQT